MAYLLNFMLRAKVFAYLFAVLLLVNFANAATIYGTVYDLSLKKVSNARVDINTIPNQFYVAQNGTYSFHVPNGKYTIKAQMMQKDNVFASVQENITISQEGSYVLDLILFPEIDEGIEDPGIDVNGGIAEETGNKDSILLIGFAVLLVLGIIAGVIYYLIIRKRGKPKSEEKMQDNEDELEQVIKIIKKEGGRATQKDIRKEIPLSEAKISLMIAELEHKGLVEKIKKGRGNIIILKKR